MLQKKLSVLVIITIFFFSLSLFAQKKKETIENQQKTEETVLQPLSVADIVSHSEKTLQVLTKFRENTIHNPEISKIKSEFRKLHEQIGQYKEETKKYDLEKLSKNKLTDLKNRLEAFNVRINSTQEILNKAINDINTGLVSLEAEKTIWEKTEKSRFKQKIPDPLVTRIKTSLKFTRDIQRVVKSELDSLLNLQSAISDDDLYVKEQLLILKEAKKSIQKRLLQIDQPPLWKISADSSLYSEIKYTLRHKKESFLNYYNYYTVNFEIHIFVFLFLFAIFFSLHIKVARNKLNKDDLNFTKVLTQYPLSITLLITCLLTPLIHSHAPSVVPQINRLILFLPVIRLLPLLFLRDLKNVIISLLILFMLYALTSLLISDADMQRIIITGLIIISLFGFIYLNRTKVITSKLTSQGNWISIIRSAFYIGIILVVVSLIAIVFGAVNFAKLLFGAELNSAYLAIVLLTGKIIIVNVGEVLFNSKLIWLSKFIKNNKDLIIKRYKKIIHFLFVLLWVMGTLKYFGIYSWIIDIIVSIFTASASIGEISISLGAILTFVLAIFLTFSASKLVRAILNDDVLPHVSLPKGIPSTILTMTHYTILMIGFLFAMSAAGMNWSNLAIIIGSLGVGIGFGLQNLVNNFVSGLILIFERPISIGDVVEVGTLMGTVKRIGIRSSTIRTFNESEVIVPNGLLISQELINWTLSDRQRRLDIPVGVAYGTDPLKVMTILQEVAEANPRVKDYPKPFITFDGFGDSSLDFLLRIWAADFSEGLSIKTDVTMEIYKRFSEENIEIPFPQRDIHIIPQNKEKDGKDKRNENEKDSLKNENTTNEIEPSGLDDADDEEN